MKKKRLLLIGGNFSPEPTGIGKYNGEMIAWLAAHGYECSVLTTYPYYPQWKVEGAYAKNAWWYTKEKVKAAKGATVTVYRCPHYVPKNPTGLRRILSDASFFVSALVRLIPLLFGKKHDLVLSVVPAFHMGLLGVLYKKIRGAMFLYHIQDLQIEAAQQLGMIPSRTIIKLLYKTEAFILRQADHVSTISEGMLKKIEQKCAKKVHLFPNWVDTSLFYPLENTASVKEEYGFLPSDKIVLYSGAIGEKQGLETVLHAAKDLQQQPVKFVICGSGPYKEKLLNLKTELGLENVTFLPLQPFEKLNAFLNMADVHLVLQKADAADLVMPSKLTTILAIGGLALVTAQKATTLYNVVTANNMGIIIEPESQEALSTAIVDAVSGNNEKLKENARVYAKQSIAIDGIFNRFLAEVAQTMENLHAKIKTSKPAVYSRETAA
jgi:colanic acid biosynthesis glycosyl transferase WcaI